MQRMNILLLGVKSQQIPVCSFGLVQITPQCDTRAFLSHAFFFFDDNTVRRHNSAATLVVIEVGAIKI